MTGAPHPGHSLPENLARNVRILTLWEAGGAFAEIGREVGTDRNTVAGVVNRAQLRGEASYLSDGEAYRRRSGRRPLWRAPADSGAMRSSSPQGDSAGGNPHV